MPRRLFAVLAVLAPPALLFWFAGTGLTAGFTPDDLMNAYGAFQGSATEYLRDIAAFFRPSRTYRPVGSLFYLLLFESFGLNPLPYRIACYGLLAANLGLSWALVRKLTGSGAVASLAVLLHAYHRGFWGIYTNTGMCYDLLCFFFYAAAFLYYLHARERRAPLGPWQVGLWSVLYLLALNSKEMAVSLPVVILAYELSTSPPAWRRIPAWLVREGRVAMVGAVITLLFIAGRVVGSGGLTAIGPYRPDLRPAVYWRHARYFLQQGLYDPAWLRAAAAAVVMVLIVLAAFAWRSTAYRVGVVLMAVGILPIAFILQRGLDAAYIPTLGGALCMAVILKALTRRLPQGSVYIGLLMLLLVVHTRYGGIDFPAFLAPGRHIGAVLEQLRRCDITRGSRVLFLRDPFPNEDWSSAFAAGLVTKDTTLTVRRADRLPSQLPPEEHFDPQVVLSYENRRLVQCEAAPLQGAATAGLTATPCTPSGSRAWYATP